MKQNPSLFCASLFMVLALWAAPVAAQDLSGSKDHPAIKRFAGLAIVTYDVKRFDEVDIPTSTFMRYNARTRMREFVSPPIKAEGMRTRIWYEAQGDVSCAEVFRNQVNDRSQKQRLKE